MKKIVGLLSVLVLSVSISTPSIAASKVTLNVANAVSVTFPASVTLKKSGCQNVAISYKIKNLGDPDFVYAGILDDSDNPIGEAVIYQSPSFAKFNGGGKFRKTGNVNLKICRKDWSDKVAATKGDWQFYVSTSEMDDLDYITFK